jgi:hypothetical protein
MQKEGKRMNHGRPIEGGAAFALARAAREGVTFRKTRNGYRILLDHAAPWLWALIPLSSEAQGDAALRLLGCGAGPSPLFFAERGRTVYIFGIDEPFDPPSGRSPHLEVRGWGEVDIPAKEFEAGVARTLAEGAIDRALDPWRPGLHKVLARWTGGPGWIDA